MAIASLFLFIIGKTFYVEVLSSNTLQLKAVDEWTREIPVTAKRGEILDVNGNVLATDSNNYCVYVMPRSVKDMSTVTSTLSGLFNVDYDDLYKKISEGKTGQIRVKSGVTKEEILRLCEYKLDGVYYTIDNDRYYPYQNTLCNILGYTTSDGTGQSGLEKYYDKYLKGIDGEILYEADLVGTDLNKSPYYESAVDGLNIKLNIDIDIQLIAEKALYKAYNEYTPTSCSCIVVEPNTGKILSMATYPNFNLNDVPRDDITTLNALSRNPLIVDAYEPGSTFKIVTALADIEETLSGNSNAKSLSYVFNNSRYRQVAGGQIKCWSNHANGKHSNQTLKEALNNSCNPCFCDIALSLGKDTMYSYIKKLNFGSKTGIDYLGESSGMLIPLASVKEGDLARISFGQSIAITPLQLAMAGAAIVNGGKYYQPQIINSVYNSNGELVELFNPKQKSVICSEQASKILSSYLEGVVKEGSGKGAYIEGYKVGGKTGTAQKYKNGVIAQGKYVMSFMGFFPSDNPQYLALVVVDEPLKGQYGSTVCAPIVKEIFEGIINIKNIKPKT